MSFQRIGILSIGEMGFNWARLLISHGAEVITYDKQRSEVTRKRAINAGVRSVPSLPDLVLESDLIVSLVVPSATKQVASDLATTLSDIDKEGLLFLDANAISPMTVQELEKVLSPHAVRFIDGCIIGSSKKLAQNAAIYVSGPEAEQIKQLEQLGFFSVRTLGPHIGQASAFKILFAGLNKGLQGLMIELLIGAKNMDLLDQLIECYDERFPGLTKKVGRNIAALPVHAGRRAEEMDELERTFRHYGLKTDMAPATQNVLKTIATLNLGQATEDGTRQGTLLEALELFFDKGLLKK